MENHILFGNDNEFTFTWIIDEDSIAGTDYFVYRTGDVERKDLLNVEDISKYYNEAKDRFVCKTEDVKTVDVKTVDVEDVSKYYTKQITTIIELIDEMYVTYSKLLMIHNDEWQF